MLIFMTTMFEQIQLTRNKISKRGANPNWDDLSKVVNLNYTRYSRRHYSRGTKSLPTKLVKTQGGWSPPISGELKFNFDVAHKDGITTTGLVLRNSVGELKGHWVNDFSHDNALCAEVEAAI